MEQRTTHLIALVEGGATLEQAGCVYGVGRERVRQILNEQGVRTDRRAARRRRSAAAQAPGQDELRARAESMWREGSSYQEVADALGVARDAIRKLICERVPRAERAALIAHRYEGQTITAEQITAALREASDVLGHSPRRPAYERLRAQGLIEGPTAGLISHQLGWVNACRLAGLESELKKSPANAPRVARR